MDKINTQRQNDSFPSRLRQKSRAIESTDLTLFITVFIAAIISLGEISLSLASIRNITMLVCVLYVLATLVYRNRYAAGLKLGKESEAYVTAYRKYDVMRCGISERRAVAKLAQFCTEYTAEELRSYREGLLAEVSLTYKDYEEKYALLTAAELRRRYRLSWVAIKAIRRCRRAKAIKLNKNMLLLNDGDPLAREMPFGISSKEKQQRDIRANMLSRVIVTLVSGAVAVNFFVEPTLECLVQWCVRMVPIVSASFLGYNSGYINGSEVAVSYLTAQIIKISEFFEWFEKKKEAGVVPPSEKDDLQSSQVDFAELSDTAKNNF